MKLATWNVNSIKVRLPGLIDWLSEASPDVVCLQEIKCVDEAFPVDAIEAAGYKAFVHGQKTYNGVAILSRLPAEEMQRGLPGDEDDEQARYLEVLVSPEDAPPLRLCGLYLPNGNPTDGPKYPYKLAWMDRLIARAKTLIESEERFVLAGDFNVIPRAEDVHDPAAWAEDALFRPETRAKFFALKHLGLTDAIEACHAKAGLFTFWDYQGGAWNRDHGIRIDHLLLSPQASDGLVGAGIDRDVRGWEKPSDHVPVWAQIP